VRHKSIETDDALQPIFLVDVKNVRYMFVPAPKSRPGPPDRDMDNRRKSVNDQNTHLNLDHHLSQIGQVIERHSLTCHQLTLKASDSRVLCLVSPSVALGSEFKNQLI